MHAHNYSRDEPRRRRFSLFGCINDEGYGLEAVVVGTFWMVEEDLAGLPELAAFDVELVVEPMPHRVSGSEGYPPFRTPTSNLGFLGYN